MDDATFYDFMGVCEQCRDLFSVNIWVRRRRGPSDAPPRWLEPVVGKEIVRGRLERSTTTHWDGTRVIHRCGGKVKVFGDFAHLRIVMEG